MQCMAGEGPNINRRRFLSLSGALAATGLAGEALAKPTAHTPEKPKAEAPEIEHAHEKLETEKGFHEHVMDLVKAIEGARTSETDEVRFLQAVDHSLHIYLNAYRPNIERNLLVDLKGMYDAVELMRHESVNPETIDLVQQILNNAWNEGIDKSQTAEKKRDIG